jgi:hypothetical protein
MKRKMPDIPEEMTFEKVQAYKAAMRRYDRDRIASGEATPEQVQWENEILHALSKKATLNFPELEPRI